MAQESFPAEIRSFVFKYLTSVGDLEALLLLQQNEPREFTAEQVATALFTNSDSESRRLATLAAQGLLAARSDPGLPAYRFAASQEHAAIIRTLASLYKERRVSLISLIYSNPLENVKGFSDAFRLWKKDKGEP